MASQALQVRCPKATFASRKAVSPATSAFEARRADNCATGAKGTKEDCGKQTFACRAHNTGASHGFFNPLSSFETEMGPTERLALSWGDAPGSLRNCRR